MTPKWKKAGTKERPTMVAQVGHVTGGNLKYTNGKAYSQFSVSFDFAQRMVAGAAPALLKLKAGASAYDALVAVQLDLLRNKGLRPNLNEREVANEGRRMAI